ncbi:GGDEF domain-containing protein [Sagittula sp. S175]|uniref:GGDEF domain-containing protein n=1 Tax=Sagittula sp. S175 TaxID=3415129 RepID=UPI003C7B7499
MIRSKGYILVVAVIVALAANLIVVNVALVGYAPLSPRNSFLVGLVLSFSVIGLFAWTMIHQAQQSARTAEELRRLVFRDRLTEVSTRDFFFDRVSRRPDVEGVVLMLDIDHFKKVNDTHGHLAGDEVIRTVASQLRIRCREEDIVCRFGGEEFLVFLAGADRVRGAGVADRLCDAVGKAPTIFDNRELRVTISVGATLKPSDMDFETAIRAADDALYMAKRRGRNRVVLAWEEQGAPLPHAPRPALNPRLMQSAGARAPRSV